MGVGRVAGRAAQRVHRLLELRVEVPRVGGVDRLLERAPLGEERVEVRVGLRHERGDLVEALLLGEDVGHGLLDVAEDRLLLVERRLLEQDADAVPRGEARLSPGYSVGILLQEPPLNEEKTVLGNVQEAVADILAKKQRFDEISALMAEPDADFDALLAERGTLQEAIDAADAWDLDSQLEQAMDALRCPPGDAPDPHLSAGASRSGWPPAGGFTVVSQAGRGGARL